jgi:hypothetical protein
MNIKTQDDWREEKMFTYLRWFVSDGFTSQRYPGSQIDSHSFAHLLFPHGGGTTKRRVFMRHYQNES